MMLHLVAVLFGMIMVALLVIGTIKTIKLAITMLKETNDPEERMALLIDLAVVLFTGAILLTIILCAYNLIRG